MAHRRPGAMPWARCTRVRTTSHLAARAIRGSAFCRSRGASMDDPAASTRNACSERRHRRLSTTHPDDRPRRRVVSSFLCHGTPHAADFRVSIFKRSPQVRTYPGKWAACSGSVEASDASPVRAALRELHEETGLTERELVRVGGGGGDTFDDASGVRFELHDATLAQAWEVWPFLWRVRDATDGRELGPEAIRRKIRLDWEHDEMRFATLEQMREMDTVEDLGRGVRAVLDSLGPET